MDSTSEAVTFERARRIAGYSWPLYVFAAAGILIGFTLVVLPGIPVWLKFIAASGSVAAIWFSVASFLAFHWMFDRSNLLSGQWLQGNGFNQPQRLVQINAGLEETTIAVEKAFPQATVKVFDIFDAQSMTEPALTRARPQSSEHRLSAKVNALPVEDQWSDLVLVVLAAHEIRNTSHREQFFRELKRIVSATGRVVVVEHLRDTWAALAFGPGLFHFFPHSEWIRLGAVAGLEVEREQSITPFVRVFVYRSIESIEPGVDSRPTKSL